ncbi:MAG: hypothetical protein GY694_05470 [Gammaproteobacteria bacterium]|nr:hypothetical protein [Gammaproteobacteria bacterium]
MKVIHRLVVEATIIGYSKFEEPGYDARLFTVLQEMNTKSVMIHFFKKSLVANVFYPAVASLQFYGQEAMWQKHDVATSRY